MTKKGAADKIRQEHLLEFDQKYRSLATFKADIEVLIATYAVNKDIKLRQYGLRWAPHPSAQQELGANKETLTALERMSVALHAHFEKDIKSFMAKHGLGRQWFVYLMQLVLIGIYDVPNSRYEVERSKDNPAEALIFINSNTTVKDALEAYKAAKTLLPPPSRRRYGNTYSSVEDPEFIDAVKPLVAEDKNIKQLSPYEKIRYAKAEKVGNLGGLANDILKNRRVQKDAGENVRVVKPKFKTTMSDREYFATTLKGKEVIKAMERVKKQRRRFKNAP